ncbi:MAG TPA: MoxR family ATPase [Planctomycetota bacterium]|nr:MoxR family ATPase [Planctomycetota bacterium]
MKDGAEHIRTEVSKIIVGQEQVLDQVLMSMLSRGHCLMVGMPGLAKTLMIHTIANVLDLQFKRIQFTPDLMPSDITGTDILEEDEATRKKSFRFIKGPIFTNILLADEINRTPPKTQAALLEAMQEYRVTASGNTYDISLPFFVLATQNPLEQEGTYPLPEAQLDRFMFNIWVDYPTDKEEECIVKQTTRDLDIKVAKVMGGEEILRLQEIVRRVPVSSHVVKYATNLVRASRPGKDNALEFINNWVHCGAGPRACQYLILGAKARAVIDGRVNVSCADVRASAIPVLRHRVYTNFNADSEGVGPVEIVQNLIEIVAEPSEKDYRTARVAVAAAAQAQTARPAAQSVPRAQPAASVPMAQEIPMAHEVPMAEEVPIGATGEKPSGKVRAAVAGGLLRQRLHEGMARSEVEAILGPPSVCKSGREILSLFGNVSGDIPSVAEQQFCLWQRPEGEWKLVFVNARLSKIVSTP